MSKYEVLYDDSGESERYNEGNWFIAMEDGSVLHDLSFYTEEEAIKYLNNYNEEDND